VAENRRDVVVRFLAQTGSLEKGTDVAQGKLRGISSSLQGIAALGAVVAGVNFFKHAIEEAEEAERVTRKTEAVIKSTGGTARVSANHIGALAQKMSTLAGVDDEVIQQGQNVLLTFTQIKNGVGKGADIFDQASLAALNMSAALDQSGDSGAAYQDNVIRLGKALNDPIAGLTALKKVGVQFTDSQKDQIKTMVEAGDVAGAQKVILSELQTEFGGAAEANATASGKASVAWGNFAEAIGEKVYPAVTAVGNWLTDVGIPKLGEFADTVGDQVGPVLHELWETGSDLVDMWKGLSGPIQAGVLALGAWALIGGKVTGIFGSMSGGARNFGSDVKTAMGAFEVNRLTGTFMALEERVPVLGKMGAAFRENASQGIALGRAYGGLSGNISALGSAAKGIGAAGFTAMKSAASGLLGVMGGPWGLAFAAGAVLVGTMVSKIQAAKAETEKWNNVGRENVRIMNDTADATAGVVRAKVTQNAADSGLIDKANELGVSTYDLVDALTGEEGARDRVNKLLDQGAEKHDRESNFLSQGADLVAGQTDILTSQEEQRKSFNQALDDTATGYQREIDARQAASEAYNLEQAGLYGVAGSLDYASLAETNWRTVLAGTDYQYDENKTGLENLTASLAAYNTETVSAMDTEEGWFASLDQLKQGVRDTGASLDIATAAGRANRDNLEELSTKSKQLYIDQINAGVSTDVATASYSRNMQQVYDTAAALGFNKSQADALIKMYGGIPSSIATQITAPGYDDVASKLANLSAQQYFLAHPKNDGSAPTVGDIRAYNKQVRAGMADGGQVRGFSPHKRADNIAANLTAGEVVQSNAAGDYYGRDFLVALNERRVPKEILPGYASGGLVAPFPVDVSRTSIPTPPAVSVGAPAGGPADGSAFAGGPGIAQMQQWARAQAGKRYLWGAVGPGSYDCSGLVGNLYAMANGLSMYRRYFTTAAMGVGKFGMKPGRGPVTVYVGPGHTAANIGGMHAEAYGGNGTPLAIGHVGTPLSYYNKIMHLADGGLVSLKNDPQARAASFAQRGWPEPGVYDNGGWLNPGQMAINRGTSPEAVLTPEESVAHKALGKAAAAGSTGTTVQKHYHLTTITQAHQVDVPLQFARMELMEGL